MNIFKPGVLYSFAKESPELLSPMVFILITGIDNGSDVIDVDTVIGVDKSSINDNDINDNDITSIAGIGVDLSVPEIVMQTDLLVITLPMLMEVIRTSTKSKPLYLGHITAFLAAIVKQIKFSTLFIAADSVAPASFINGFKQRNVFLLQIGIIVILNSTQI